MSRLAGYNRGKFSECPMPRSLQSRYITLLCSTLFALSGCAFNSKSPESTLYSRLGGEDGLSKIVDAFTVNCVSDPRINSYFLAVAGDKVRLRRLKDSMISQICTLSGGPCEYSGKDMHTAHAGMGISNKDFSAMIESLVHALDQSNISKGDQETLVGILGPMRKDIVEDRS